MPDTISSLNDHKSRESMSMRKLTSIWRSYDGLSEQLSFLTKLLPLRTCHIRGCRNQWHLFGEPRHHDHQLLSDTIEQSQTISTFVTTVMTLTMLIIPDHSSVQVQDYTRALALYKVTCSPRGCHKPWASPDVTGHKIHRAS